MKLIHGITNPSTIAVALYDSPDNQRSRQELESPFEVSP